MALVTVRINGFPQTVGCEDGQEAHLLEMAAEVDRRIDSIKGQAGQGSETRLLTLAALMLADEVSDLQAALEKAGAAPASPESPGGGDPELPRRLLSLARRAEEIAAGLERA